MSSALVWPLKPNCTKCLSAPIRESHGLLRYPISLDQTCTSRLFQPLDYETKKAYTFKVEASNPHLDPRFHSAGPFKDTATVKIIVLDVDEPPVFSMPAYGMNVYEDTPVGIIIGAVTAQDLDIGGSAVR